MCSRHVGNLMDEQTINQMFELTYMNMSKIIPSATTKEEDYALWRESFDKGRKSGTKHILYFRHDVLRGYISYTIREYSNDIYWNEIQIHPQSQRDSITFRKLLSQFLNEIEVYEADTIRTYANNLNRRSQRLIQKLGFSIEAEIEKGVRYKISRTKFLRRLNHLRKGDNQCKLMTWSRLKRNIRRKSMLSG